MDIIQREERRIDTSPTCGQTRERDGAGVGLARQPQGVGVARGEGGWPRPPLPVQIRSHCVDDALPARKEMALAGGSNQLKRWSMGNIWWKRLSRCVEMKDGRGLIVRR